MNARRARWTAALVAATVTAAACAGTPPGRAPAPQAAAVADLEALYQARTDSARLRFTEADVRFMAGMIAHHAQALVMAALAPTNRASPSLQTLAARIINAQNDEIATMQRWLSDRGRPAPEVHIDGTRLMLHGPGEHGMLMPGMLTPEQLGELEAARGEEFDRLFLTFMIQHHHGAVTMVHDLFAADGAAEDEEAFKLASDIQVDQLTEIARMQRMLDALGNELSSSATNR
jgi:uncharacterized protein (DUF305 family)